MLGSIWIIQRGAEGAREFVRIVDGAVTWVADRADAEPFDTKDEALAVALPAAIKDGVWVAVYPLDDDRTDLVPDRPGVPADLDYIRRAATARATRVGPGPDRPAVHGFTS